MDTNLLVGYTGAYQDPVTGSYPLGNGYRMYLPELMRFNSPDRWSPFGKGGIHPYAYCAGDPINHVDPSGHFSVLSLMVEAMMAEEAANVAARGLANAVAAAREEGAVDAGLAAATAVAVDEGVASSSRAAEVPAKRPRMEDPEEQGTSQSTAPQPDRPIENTWRPDEPINYADVRTDLEFIEGRLNVMRTKLDRVFNGGDLTDRSLRELWARRNFTEGRRKATRINAGATLDTLREFSAQVRERFANVNRSLSRIPDGRLESLPQEHFDLTGRALGLFPRIQQLGNDINDHQEVLNEFVRLGQP